MSSNETTKYFDLHINGIGYLNRIRDVTPKEGSPFLSVSIAALRGTADNAEYTYFECVVSGKQAQEIVRRVKPAVDAKLKVLLGFTLSDLSAEPFTYQQSDRTGEMGINLKSRLLRITWAKVDGQSFYKRQEVAA